MHMPRTLALVEIDSGCIPTEDRPFHTPTAPLRRLSDAVAEQRIAYLLAAIIGQHKQIFEIERWAGQEGRVGLEYKGIAHCFCANISQEDVKARTFGKGVSD